MLSKILSAAVVGLSAVPVTVEVDIASGGLPSFSIVGLPDKAVEESRERVRSAIKNSGAEFPVKRITVNLAPADLPKIGPAYDLPIAVGILAASGQISGDLTEGLYVGELSLDGGLNHTNGILPITILAKRLGVKRMYIPSIDAGETSIVNGVCVFGVRDLVAFLRHVWGSEQLTAVKHREFVSETGLHDGEFDLADVVGQEQAKFALEIAAAGGHNVLMVGPPGAGKTLLARTVPSILPAMTEAEAIEVTNIFSVSGCLPPGVSIMRTRPFRSPHHTTSRVGLIGGGTHPAPGEISLAHRGVLFLDEFPEFPRNVLEALRQPMEDGIVTVSRAVGTVRFPAKFMLVAAANPCPCGNYGSSVKKCICPPGVVERYRRRISGPIIDRIDIVLSVPAVETEKLAGMETHAEKSDMVGKRVQKARDIQTARYRDMGIVCNAELSTRQVKEVVKMDSGTIGFMKKAAGMYGLSARGYFRVLKVARTIADLRGRESVGIEECAGALQFRPSSEI